jgi:hypothetical protein
MAQRKPIFQLKADCDPTEFVTVRLTQNYVDGTTVKREAPTMDGTSMEAVFYCIREFQEIADELNFTTADEFFNNFRRILRNSAKDDWDSVIAPLQHRTPATFLLALDQWKSNMMLPTACQTLVHYLETLIKPCKMTVEAFVNRLKVMVCYVNDIPFPGPDPPVVQQTKLKNIIFRAMSTTWQTNFLRANGDVSTSSVLQLQQFMSQEREFAEGSNPRTFSSTDRTGPRDNRAYNNSGQNRHAGRGGGRNNYAISKRPWHNNNNSNSWKRNMRPRMTPRDSPC